MHRNAPLTPEGRLRLCRLIEDGLDRGLGGRVLADLPPDGPQVVASLPRGRRCGPGGPLEPAATLPDQDPGQGGAPGGRAPPAPPARSQPVWRQRAGIPASTLHGSGLATGCRGSRTSSGEAGRVIRRIETIPPGELVHIDIKKQAKIPKGGGWQRSTAGQSAPRAATARSADPAWATPTSIRPSTPTLAWPTRRSTPTSRR